MSDREFHILLIEDNKADAELCETILSLSNLAKFKVETVTSLSQGLDRLKTGNIDAILLDLSLPDSSGLDTLVRVQLDFKGVPVVILSSTDDVALEAAKLGAQDWIVKGPAMGPLIARSIIYAVERKGSEERIKQ